jgi:hypothetical protein
MENQVNGINTYNSTIGAVNQRQRASALDVQEGGNMQTFSAGSIITEQDQYALKCGAVVESRYGYASQLDMVSRDYATAIYNRNYNEAVSQDIVAVINDKYKQLVDEIKNNYSGEEQEQRLNELSTNYDEIINHNIVKPLMHNLQFESMANKLREKIGMFYDKTKESEGVSVAELKYGNMADWREITEKIGTQLDNFKTLFDDIREAIKNSKDIDGADKYLDSVLKTINSGMAGIEKEKYEFQNTLDSEENGKLKELWDLIEQKTDVYRDYSKQYASDEEKYQSFLKQSTQFNGIDSRIDELLSDIY